jgi:hypothetical protein
MKRLGKILVLGFIVGVLWTASGAPDVCAQVHLNLNIGPPPVFAFPQPPQLAVIPGTYVYGVPGIEAELLFYHGRWYRPHGGNWFYARSYNGPWVHLASARVPRPLFALPPPGHRFPPGHRAMRCNHVQANWRKWEREQHWHRDKGWEGHGGGSDWARGHEEHGGGHKGKRG